MADIKLSFNLSITSTNNDIACFTSIASNKGIILYKCPFDKGERHEFTIEDIEDGYYEVRIKMSGKTDADTVLDGDKIIESTVLEFDDFRFDNFCFDDILSKVATYTHDNNGYGEMHDEKFDFVMGCNGEVTFKFTTPLYLWLLENAD